MIKYSECIHKTVEIMSLNMKIREVLMVDKTKNDRNYFFSVYTWTIIILYTIEKTTHNDSLCLK